MVLLDFVNKVLAAGAIGAQVFIVVGAGFVILNRKKNKVSSFFARNGIRFSFFVALAATAGSLFYSGYAGFVPCSLCWFQRIFMYPEVILLGLAWLKNEKHIIDYSLTLSIIGWLISAYHNYIIYKGLHSIVCTISEPCTVNYVLEYGYITIPMMALTAFSLIILFLIFQKYENKQ